MLDITAIILTKNEQINLPDCIDSICDHVKRIVVVDSFSDDSTEAICLQRKVDFYQNKFINYATQFNWGIDNTNIKTKWILRIDADERFTPELWSEIESILTKKSDDISGIVMESWLYFLGKKIKHGCHNKRKIMLFKKGIGRIENRRMDEHTVIESGTVVQAKNRFIHYDFKNLNHWINKMNWYATREMQDYFEYVNGKQSDFKGNDKTISKTRKKKFGFYYKLPLFIRSWMLFVYYYVFRFGFLDGREGFVYHWMYHRWYRTLVDSKILEQKKTNRPFEETGDLK